MPVSALQMARLRKHTQRGATPGPFNPPPGLWIGGVNYTAYKVAFSQSLEQTLSPYVGIFRVTLDGSSAALSAIAVEQELTFNQDGVQYAGKIRSLDPLDQVIASANRTLKIVCQDLTSLLDGDLCAVGVSAPQVDPNRTVVETDAQRINWLLSSFGRQAVTQRHVLTLYATVPATDYTGMTLREAIKSVADYSAASFYVDFGRDLHVFVDERQYAAFTLSETPNDSTSFSYGHLQYPSDSVNLRNAVFVTGGVPALPVSLTETIITAGAVSEREWGAVTLKRDGSSRIVEVARGPVAVSPSATTCTPAFSQSTKSGNCAIAIVSGCSPNAPATTTPGWINVQNGGGGPGPTWVSVFAKPNCDAAEIAPTFTVAAGSATFFAQLLEFSGVATIPNPSVFSGGGSGGAGTTITHTNFQLDPENGDLFIFVSSYTLGSATASFVDLFNNTILAVQTGHTGDVSRPRHACFAYGIGPRGRWYTDETSIASVGRREGTTSVPDTMLPASVDAIAAAYLTANANPRREGSFTCWTAGLAPGQRFTIQSSLYAIPTVVDSLGNYSAIVQGITASWLEDERSPKFEVEFGAPTADLAVQLKQALS